MKLFYPTVLLSLLFLFSYCSEDDISPSMKSSGVLDKSSGSVIGYGNEEGGLMTA